MIRDLIKNLITKILTSQKWPVLDINEITIGKPDNHDFGDYSLNIAFGLAKQLKKPPQEVAQILAEEINKEKPAEIGRVEAVGGYVNFFLSNDFLRQSLADIYKNRKSYGKSRIGKGQKVIIEYSQPNIAKQMHIGHLRTTVFGDTLANIYENLGYKVVRWNYLGDWGTQFGKLIAAYKLWGNKKEIEISPIRTLNDLYVKFHRELKEHPELDRRGQEEFAKLETGDKENRKLWEWFRKLSVKEFEKIYKTLGISFDVWLGESHFERELKSLVSDLRKRGIAEIGEKGAIIINLAKHLLRSNLNSGGLTSTTLTKTTTEKEITPALIQKADGASLYLTRDIAALRYRLNKYTPAKLLYVVGNEQSLHFEQLFAIAKILGWNESELAHIKYGLVLGEDKKKMSTREGEAIPLEDVIKKAINLARDVVDKKGNNLSEKEKSEIARTVALGALRYEMLKEHRSSDIVFSWGKMLDFTGNSAPYLQYTYARLASIIRKAGFIEKLNFSIEKLSFSTLLRFNLNKLTEKSELAIIKRLLDFPDVVADSARNNLTNNLALYLYELANLANRFYETTPILKDDNTPRLNAHLILIQTTDSILESGLKLLGINVLDRI